MKQITKEMLKIYKPYSNLDWLNYKLVRSQLTFHHIQKKCDGGKEIITNGALLMPTSHQYLHIIEYVDNDRYKTINKIFEFINKQQREPTQDQRDILEYLLSEFEEQHKRDKTSKGKILIKREYMQRWK